MVGGRMVVGGRVVEGVTVVVDGGVEVGVVSISLCWQMVPTSLSWTVGVRQLASCHQNDVELCTTMRAQSSVLLGSLLGQFGPQEESLMSSPLKDQTHWSSFPKHRKLQLYCLISAIEIKVIS